MTPMIGWLYFITAPSVVYIWMPLMKLFVSSIGSSTQR